MITFTIEADYMKDHSPKDLCHSCFHAVYIEIPHPDEMGISPR